MLQQGSYTVAAQTEETTRHFVKTLSLTRPYSFLKVLNGSEESINYESTSLSNDLAILNFLAFRVINQFRTEHLARVRDFFLKSG